MQTFKQRERTSLTDFRTQSLSPPQRHPLFYKGLLNIIPEHSIEAINQLLIHLERKAFQ